MANRSNSIETTSTARGGKIMTGHAPDRESFGDNAKTSAMPKDMKNVGLSHSITADNKVKQY